jgi:hypothetical protein
LFVSLSGVFVHKKAVISAVYDDDLSGFLAALGVLGNVKHGKAKCKFCQGTVSLTSLAAVFPESGDIKFVCDQPSCLKALAESRSELRGQESGKKQDTNSTGEVARARAHEISY